jgi:peptide/nickel transport system substrate-binding protein
VVDYSYDKDKANGAFKTMGYVFNEESGLYETEDGEILSFTLSFLDNDYNNVLVDTMYELLYEQGVVLKKDPLSYAQISQETIATRSFDMLLYEIEITIDPDQYNLWHSLKSNYPDLNISGYNYERVDILLEEARESSDLKVRKEKYALFQKYLMNDAPVVFLYHPVYTYVVNSDFENIDISNIQYVSQRFENIDNWSIR